MARTIGEKCAVTPSAMVFPENAARKTPRPRSGSGHALPVPSLANSKAKRSSSGNHAVVKLTDTNSPLKLSPLSLSPGRRRSAARECVKNAVVAERGNHPDKQGGGEIQLAVTGELDQLDTDAFEELTAGEAYAPAIRRRPKPKRKSAKWLTPMLIIRTVVGSVGLVILAVVASQVGRLLESIKQALEPVAPTPVALVPVATVAVNPAPPVADKPVQVTIKTRVNGARLLIDGEQQGVTPIGAPIELKPGPHRLELAFGGTRLQETIQTSSGQALSWPPTDFTSGQIAETCKQSVCLLRTPEGHGSGFLVHDQQTLVTAAHVIDNVRSLDDLEFVFSPSADKNYPSEDELNLRGAQLIHFDRAVDVAVLRLKEPVPNKRLPLLLSVGKAELQTPVVAIGNPGYGKGRYLPLDITPGIITNNNPLMTDSNIKGGYSGGPVINAQSGEVVGITSAKLVCSGIGRGDTFIRSYLSPVFLIRKALTDWNALNPDEQTARANEVQRAWTQHVSDRRVFQAGVYLAVTSDLYHMIATQCADLWKEAYRVGCFEAANKVNKALDGTRREIKKNFNAELEALTDRHFETVLNDPLIDADTRATLEQAHRDFEQLQRDATELEGQLNVPDKANKCPKREKTFEHRVDTAKENLDKALKPLLKELAKKLAVEDYVYPRLGN